MHKRSENTSPLQYFEGLSIAQRTMPRKGISQFLGRVEAQYILDFVHQKPDKSTRNEHEDVLSSCAEHFQINKR